MMVCPKDNTHDRFIATAHVTEDWVVDGGGNYIEHAIETDCQVLHAPDEEDIWTCAICGTEAISKAEGGE
tara:strand:- start:341 stop:550 length:210 start_codon:yes stop_codon:yes gene_type:complete